MIRRFPLQLGAKLVIVSDYTANYMYMGWSGMSVISTGMYVSNKYRNEYITVSIFSYFISWFHGMMFLQLMQMRHFSPQYGTTALIWACRKGHLEIVETLLGEGATVDASGMVSSALCRHCHEAQPEKQNLLLYVAGFVYRETNNESSLCLNSLWKKNKWGWSDFLYRFLCVHKKLV